MHIITFIIYLAIFFYAGFSLKLIDQVNDEDYEYVGKEKYRQILENGIGIVETRFKRKNGKIIDVLLSSAPINPINLNEGVTFTASDITERKKTEQKIRESEKKLIDLIEAVPVGISMTTPEGKTIECNTKAYKTFGYPHTSCGCFEGVAFYIPEVDGFGVVHRGFQGETVNGLPFSTIADSTAGGRQVDGFHGISIEYMRSPKFLRADGGWNRVVWLPASVKERVKDFIPKEVVDKVATETEAKTVSELKAFLEERSHPIVETWKKPAAIEKALPTAVEAETPIEMPAGMPVATVPTLPITAGGYKILMKNAKIYANKIIIRPIKGEKVGGRKK